MDSTDVGRALDGSLTLLTAPPDTTRNDAAWDAPAGGLNWTCRETAAHISHDLLAYAMQLATTADADYLPLDLTVPPQTPARTLLQIMAGTAALLRHQLDAAPDARAWHWGPTDPSGFAALAVNEILVHTWDIAQGLHLAWTPPADLSAAVLARLFPAAEVPPAADPHPGRTLLWATGRIALDAHPRRTEWRIKAAAAS